MKKMQWPILKIIPLLFLFPASLITPAYSQISAYRLQRADSLFNAKQFTQALGHYEEIFRQKQYSPAMLLKMAFVEEGLNHVGESLYYLNLYYLATNDESVLAKMEQLSGKHRLRGYSLSELEQATIFYQRYHSQVAMAIGAVMLFLFSLAVFLKRRNHRPIAVLITLTVVTTLFALHLFAGEPEDKVIVAGENNYLMAGPSGAAPVVAIVSGGHRFEIEKRYDIWIQVRWKGKRAFIRESQILPVHL
jgi:hypothetical protein